MKEGFIPFSRDTAVVVEGGLPKSDNDAQIQKSRYRHAYGFEMTLGIVGVRETDTSLRGPVTKKRLLESKKADYRAILTNTWDYTSA